MKFLTAPAIITLLLTCCGSNQEQTSGHVSVEQLKEKIEDGEDIQLIDVRTPAEIQHGVLPGKKIYIQHGTADYREKLSQLDKSGTYYLYCHSGARSGQMAAQMGTMGFRKVYNVVGGIAAWQRNGYKIE
ncbi:rhodanese-like domain-containing protein [Fulvivirgaceae bacterium BMA12]|uniref:Rhodanese-like domain-containing protein n=1 Tax=Agaribacillus aureus TaxID=3051825 RepID=A0ABT8LC95_9BACT|nr:rhodanese-like domain-containing protein [Fulvivirgaceae bacterium BMA12]